MTSRRRAPAWAGRGRAEGSPRNCAEDLQASPPTRSLDACAAPRLMPASSRSSAPRMLAPGTPTVSDGAVGQHASSDGANSGTPSPPPTPRPGRTRSPTRRGSLTSPSSTSRSRSRPGRHGSVHVLGRSWPRRSPCSGVRYAPHCSPWGVAEGSGPRSSVDGLVRHTAGMPLDTLATVSACTSA